jgi:hypothetical protein
MARVSYSINRLVVVVFLLTFANLVPQAGNQMQDRAQAVPEAPVQLAPKEPEPFDFSAPMPAMSAQDL